MVPMYNWTRRLLEIFAVALLAAVVATCLPDRPYERWKLLDNTILYRLRWIYERVNYDNTPVDVAIIGSSRSQAAVDAPRLEDDLFKRGINLRIVNFSVPVNGRDLHYVILRELLRHKHPKIIVIPINELPERTGHEAYKYVANPYDIIRPRYFGDLRYLGNVIFLPYRQGRVFATWFLKTVVGQPMAFDRSIYPGSNIDTTRSFMSKEGHWVEQEKSYPGAVLQVARRRFEHTQHAPYLSKNFADLEFGNERSSIRRMVTLARLRNVNVVFLFIPYYGSQDRIEDVGFYKKLAPLIDGSSFSSRSELYSSDVRHMNHAGAEVFTDWLAQRLPFVEG